MSSTKPFSPAKVVREFQEQVASEKRRLGFFFGAGSSMAVGIPGIDALTLKVMEQVSPQTKPILEQIHTILGSQSNIEDILNRVRTIKDLLNNSSNTQGYDGIGSIELCQKIDRDICQQISRIVGVEPPQGLGSHRILAQWLKYSQANRSTPIEVFTTNYDLLIEQAFEELLIPYFDGFVGSVCPFFLPESVEDFDKGNHISPPCSWIRLWKIHGSINWCTQKNVSGLVNYIQTTNRQNENDDLMIFPSKDKYIESRKLPFLTLHDRLRTFLGQGETLFIIVGYSFSDQHINETIFQALRANKRLAVTALVFGDEVEEGKTRVLNQSLIKYAIDHPNLSILGPDKAVIGGTVGTWEIETASSSNRYDNSFWESENGFFTLGDFIKFSMFLQNVIGYSQQVSSVGTSTESVNEN